MSRMNKKGVNPPQQGRIVQATKAPDNTAGRKAETGAAGYPAHKMTAGAAPKAPAQSVGSATASENRVRSGSDPTVKMATAGNTSTAGQVASGAPPSQPNGGNGHKMASDLSQQATDKGRAYAKGGKINRHGTDVGNNTTGLNAGIPKGDTSTGIVAKGTMGATGDTHLDDNTGVSSAAAPVTVMPTLRGPSVKRAGAAPSLPRPRR